MIYKQPGHDLDLCGHSFARYSEKCFTQIYRAFYGEAMLVPFGGIHNFLFWKMTTSHEDQN